MKDHKWVTPNRQLFESEHKTFNRQTNLIDTGNVYSNTQTSSYVRPYSETECNGFTRPPGHLRDFDLKGFDHMPHRVKCYILSVTQDRPVIVYKFFHHTNRGRITHGWVITTTAPEYRKLMSFVTGPTWKSESVIAEAIKYITND